MSKIKLKVKTKAAPAEKKFHTVQCEECGKVFPMSHDDCHIGAYGCPWTTCPHCGKRTYVLCDEETLTLTEDNFHYPQHFDKIDEHYVRKITDAEIEGMCKRTVKGLRNPGVDFSYEATGDSLVIALNCQDETDIFVCKGYSETILPKYTS